MPAEYAALKIKTTLHIVVVRGTYPDTFGDGVAWLSGGDGVPLEMRILLVGRVLASNAQIACPQCWRQEVKASLGHESISKRERRRKKGEEKKRKEIFIIIGGGGGWVLVPALSV